ncbi:selenocysteine-specific translation elongation factor [uncultured Sulfitobacter sp.]|uniref:selenocysteine-specific translation elongation factor n=1 Tax=uncultured Sulfitobacter sp. TaxID=191468 RepID=UPI00262650D4|nr:selenocysteine-specific translation elongation factor [uncultured Sulfitobacter sp.]
MTSCCVVVIGHVDHGKTALVRALSGIETDRLPEEKARGLSIAAGYAHRAYEDGMLDLIDAPGHEDFIQAMISGATGARGALVVISATEGICAQTREHLSIAGLLGISSAVIAVTKSDLIAPQDHDARVHEIRAGLSGGPFADAPVVLCSAITGAGLNNLHGALGAFLAKGPLQAAPTNSFLPLDRVFSLPGRGTIVTGTLLGADLVVDDAVVLHPQGCAVTIRGLESRGTARETALAGERVAVNLRGIAIADVARGNVLCAGGTAAPSTCVDVRLTLLSCATTAIKHMDELRVSFGTTNAVANVRLFGGGRLAAGQSAFAQLRFKQPVTGFAGQRAVLRRLSPPETIAGAIFLDPSATPARSGDRQRSALLYAVEGGEITSIAQALSAAGDSTLRVSHAARLARITENAAHSALQDTFEWLEPDRMTPRARIEAAKAAVLDTLAAYHVAHPLRSMAPHGVLSGLKMAPALLAYVLTHLTDTGTLCVRGAGLALTAHDPVALLSSAQKSRMDGIDATHRDAGLSAPGGGKADPDHGDAALVDLLVDTGKLVALRNVALKQTVILHVDALSTAAVALRAAFPPPTPFTTSQARTVLGTTRRIVVPLLEHFDKTRVTIREGDTRHLSVA